MRGSVSISWRYSLYSKVKQRRPYKVAMYALTHLTMALLGTCVTPCALLIGMSQLRLIVELYSIPDTPVSLHVLSNHASCWLAYVCIVHCYVTNKVQITCHCKFSVQDFVTYINGQLSQKQYTQQCVVIVVETNVFFGMESRLILANQGEKTVPLDNRGLNEVHHNPWGYSE